MCLFSSSPPSLCLHAGPVHSPLFTSTLPAFSFASSCKYSFKFRLRMQTRTGLHSSQIRVWAPPPGVAPRRPPRSLLTHAVHRCRSRPHAPRRRHRRRAPPASQQSTLAPWPPRCRRQTARSGSQRCSARRQTGCPSTPCLRGTRAPRPEHSCKGGGGCWEGRAGREQARRDVWSRARERSGHVLRSHASFHKAQGKAAQKRT